MLPKQSARERAIQLRKSGHSYSEIQKQVAVSKASLSLWLRYVPLSKKHKARLAKKKLIGQASGARKRKQQRLDSTEIIHKNAAEELGLLDKKAFCVAGAALYWAEGNKQKDHNVSTGVKFSNSDPKMVILFYKWLQEICQVNEKDINFEMYIHETADIKKAQIFWAKKLRVNKVKLRKIRLKKTTNNNYRKNQGKEYNGLIRINVVKSTNLNRKIMSWAEELYNQFA